jgi:methionine synthase II (cobalamin-independent)
MIHKDILIEELVAIIPESVSYLMKKGIKCIACGEPIWGTLADATKEKGFSEKELDRVVEELNQLEIKNKS